MKRYLVWIILGFFLLSCGKNPSASSIPAGLTLSGPGVEGGEAERALAAAADGGFCFYGDFVPGGEIYLSKSNGQIWKSLEILPPKAGPGFLRVDAQTGEPSIVHINKVTLEVTEGGVENPKVGNKPPIDATYKNGVWKVEKLYIATDHVRYRYILDTDAPERLKYWVATWDNAGTAPSACTADYLKVRSLGQDAYTAAGLRDTRACWMFPEDKTLKVADFTLSIQTGVPVQEVVFGSGHSGPKAAFIGDSITWQWGTSPREISKDKFVLPAKYLSPLPYFLQDRGGNYYVTWHADFFTTNNYIDVGVSGERTNQMVSRFKRDVLDKDPSVVVIMGGTNDLAHGYAKSETLSNLSSMAEQADAANMKVVMCSITPCNAVYSNLSNPNTKGAHILALNAMIKDYAERKGFTYCDYYPVLVGPDGLEMEERFWLYDTLHPNPFGYDEMEKVIKPIIDRLLE